MNKQNEIEKLRSDIEALEAKVPESEPEPDMTPMPGDEGCWVMVWNKNTPERGPYLLTKAATESRPFYDADGGLWTHARIIPAPIRGVLKEHDGSNHKPEWLGHDDIVIIEYANDSRVLVDEAHTALWGDVVRYQKLEVK